MEYVIWNSQPFDIIKLNRYLNVDTVKDFTSKSNDFVQNRSGFLLVDMSTVEEIDSSGIGALVFLYKRLVMRNRQLILLKVNGQPEKLLAMLRVNNSIEQYSSLTDFINKLPYK